MRPSMKAKAERISDNRVSQRPKSGPDRADFRHCPPLRRLYFNVSKRAANPS